MDIDESSAINDAFWEFHEQFPNVYRELVRLARDGRRLGRDRIGIGMLWEVMRWNLRLDVEDRDGFKLNNNFRSRYARLIMESEADLADVFEIRTLRS